MSRTKIIILAVVAIVLAGGIWKLNAYFAATMDWPLVIMNAKSDAINSKEQDGNYSEALISQSLADHLATKGAAGQVSLISADNGERAAVVVTGLSARSCHGLEHHPELEKNFESIEVQNGLCTQNSTMKFWFK